MVTRLADLAIESSVDVGKRKKGISPSNFSIVSASKLGQSRTRFDRSGKPLK